MFARGIPFGTNPLRITSKELLRAGVVRLTGVLESAEKQTGPGSGGGDG